MTDFTPQERDVLLLAERQFDAIEQALYSLENWVIPNLLRVRDPHTVQYAELVPTIQKFAGTATLRGALIRRFTALAAETDDAITVVRSLLLTAVLTNDADAEYHLPAEAVAR